MAENKQIAYSVKVFDILGNLLQPNYRLVIPHGATGFGLASGESSIASVGATADTCTAAYIASADTLNNTKSCGYPTSATTLIIEDSTTAAEFPLFNFGPIYSTITTLGGVIFKFLDNRHEIKLTPYSTDRLTITYSKDGTVCGYVTPALYFNNSRGAAISIPWLYPADENANLRAYTLFFEKPSQYRITWPALRNTRQANWPSRVDTSSEGTDVTNIHTFFTDLPDPYDWDDPYADIPNSEPSGPAPGEGIPENDPIAIPDLPSVSASDTGFITLFNPTLSQVKDLAEYMWTGLFDLATYKKIFADPMDCLLGFNMLPVAIPHGTSVPVRVGNISTGINMNPATAQWVEVDCGALNLADAFGCYLSYAPYTKVSIYLPYIGTQELSTDDLVGKTLSLKYHVDCLSCACVAYLKCGDSVMYQFTGSCGYSIPVSSNDFRSTVGAIVTMAVGLGGAIATGGLSAPISAAEGIKAGASVAQNVMNSKPEIHRSGSIGSAAGIMGIQTPYLIVEYPNPCKPAKQYHYLGYPSFVTVKLGNISGYAEFDEVIIENVPCTEEEAEMIKNLCKGGIHL